MARAIKNQRNNIDIDINQIMKGAITETLSEMSSESTTGLMNITDFCKHILQIDFLDRPYLELILKMWYMNTTANEDLKITEEDIALIDKIDNYGNGNPWLKNKAIKLMNGEIKKPFKYFVGCLGRRSGKAGTLDSKVLTPTGWKRMGDIRIGDQAISVDGMPTRVNGVYPQGKKDIYRITMSDGAHTECCGEHLWFTETRNDRKNQKRCKDKSRWAGSVKSTLEIMNSLRAYRRDAKKENNHKIPLVRPVQFDDQPIFVDPYLIGLLLGDGCLSATNAVTFATSDKQLAEAVNDALPNHMELLYRRNYDYAIVNKDRPKTTGTRYTTNAIIEENKRLDMQTKRSHEKFIPDCYKFNSVDIRIATLQGLMDSDGTVDHRQGKLSFSSSSERLSRDVMFLVHSLGGTASIHSKKKKYTYNGEKKVGRVTWEIQIKLPKNISPFRLERKANIYAKYISRMRDPIRTINDIEYVGKKEAQCISVEHPSRLYITDDFIVTHNTHFSSIIQSYDTYKLLFMNVCPECKDIVNIPPGDPCPKCNTQTRRHPQAYFGGSGSEPLRIIMAATSLDQAVDPGLKFFQERVLACPLFEGRSELETEKTFFKTDFDMDRNRKFGTSSKRIVTKGSVMARAIAANSKGIHGLSAVLLSFDEFALFSLKKAESEAYPDEAMLEALVPATSQFEVIHPEFGRVIMISAPQFKQGKFYQSYKAAQDTADKGDNYLMVQMPTWEWCTSYTREFFENQFMEDDSSDAMSFDKVYGAQFLDETENSYLPEEATELCFSYLDVKKGMPRKNHNHCMHIDCAYNTCNYAYCVIHTESRHSEKTGKLESFFVEDDSYFWTPSQTKPDYFVDMEGNIVDAKQIWDRIVTAAKKYRVKSVSYDNMQTPESKVYFRKKGLPLRTLSFAGKLKATYYGLLKNNINEGRVALCQDDHRLRNELLNLKVKYTMRGPKIYPNPNGVVKTMDVADCLAGACYMTSLKTGSHMTSGKLIDTPFFNANNKDAGKSIFSRELPNIKFYGG